MIFKKVIVATPALLTLALLLSAATLAAQIQPAPPLVADPADTRFKGVKEDWTTPSLATSSLRPATPLIGSVDDSGNRIVEFVKVQWRWGDPIYLYVMKPKGVKNPPVILFNYGYPADTNIFRDEKYEVAVTRDGFAAVGFVNSLTGHRYHDRSMKDWFVSEFPETLSTSAHDIQEIIDYLSSRGDLDTTRLGMYAQGAGASIAIMASAVDPRIKVLDALDPWGDWPVWLTTSPFIHEELREPLVKPDFLKKVAPLEPTDWLPKVQAAKFRFQQTAFEPSTPTAAKDKLRAAVPHSATVVVYKTQAEYNAAIVGPKQLDWIHQAMQSLPQPEPAPQKSAAAK
jgi:hypothetical protein